MSINANQGEAVSSMMDWVTGNVGLLSLAVSAATLAVWLIYLQVFLFSYRRQTRSKIVINMGAGSDLDARCLVSNMSSEAIYVESIVASLITNEDDLRGVVTDIDIEDGEEKPTDPKKLTHQGPLKAGEYMDVGSYRELLGRVVRGRGRLAEVLKEAPTPVAAQIQVIADYASEDLLVGARRRFELCRRDGQWFVKAYNQETKQIRPRRERRRLSGSPMVNSSRNQ